jgi:hypothetical protein
VNPAVAATARNSAEGAAPECAEGTVPDCARGAAPECAEGAAAECAEATAPRGFDPLTAREPFARTASSRSTNPWITLGVTARIGRPNLIAIARHP